MINLRKVNLQDNQMFFFNLLSPSTIILQGSYWGSWDYDGPKIAKHFMLGGLDGAEFKEIWSN